jgi:tRNA nucleotidyltransferase (CCA-adding enzyme)
LDPFYGQEDLTGRTIRALHPQSFVDDPTRVYRAARFAGRLGFLVASDTEQWIKGAVEKGLPKLLSPVRRRHEFELILKENNPAQALELLNIWNALVLIHPKWTECSDTLLSIMARRPPERLPVPVLTWRLAVWFKAWGGDAAMQMMTDLAFEKEMKKDVLALL